MYARVPHMKKLTKKNLTLSVQLIERRIYLIRGQKVMVDEDLAELLECLQNALTNRYLEIANVFLTPSCFGLQKPRLRL